MIPYRKRIYVTAQQAILTRLESGESCARQLLIVGGFNSHGTQMPRRPLRQGITIGQQTPQLCDSATPKRVEWPICATRSCTICSYCVLFASRIGKRRLHVCNSGRPDPTARLIMYVHMPTWMAIIRSPQQQLLAKLVGPGWTWLAS